MRSSDWGRNLGRRWMTDGMSGLGSSEERTQAAVMNGKRSLHQFMYTHVHSHNTIGL